MVGVGGTMSHKLKRGRALSERADSKVERIDMATQHPRKSGGGCRMGWWLGSMGETTEDEGFDLQGCN
jgi:hypothetical protein